MSDIQNKGIQSYRYIIEAFNREGEPETIEFNHPKHLNETEIIQLLDMPWYEICDIYIQPQVLTIHHHQGHPYNTKQWKRHVII